MSVSSLRVPRRELAKLRERFESALENHEALRDVTESSVARWQWASSDMYDLDPLFFLDSHFEVGQALAKKPTNLSGKVAYGFSKDDQLVVERAFTEFPENFYCSFYNYHPDRIVGYRFHQTQSLAIVNCSQLILEHSLPVCFQRWGRRGWTSYSYKSTGRRIDCYAGISMAEEESERRFSGKLAYKDNGLVELWVTEGDRKTPELSFRGMSPTASPFILP